MTLRDHRMMEISVHGGCLTAVCISPYQDGCSADWAVSLECGSEAGNAFQLTEWKLEGIISALDLTVEFAPL